MDDEEFEKRALKFFEDYTVHICLVAITVNIAVLFVLHNDVGAWYYILFLFFVAAFSVAAVRETTYLWARQLPGRQYPILYRLVVVCVCAAGALLLEVLHRMGYFYGDHASLVRVFQITCGLFVALTVFQKTPRRTVHLEDETQDS